MTLAAIPVASRCYVAPSVLACDLSDLAREAQRVFEAGADWIHLDVMDGHFVPNISFGAPVIKWLHRKMPSKTALGAPFFDCHLMVSNPEKWVTDMKAAGVDQFTFHFEAVKYSNELAISLARSIRDSGMLAGLCLKPSTSLEEAVASLDTGLFTTLLIMTVEPGFGGQNFMFETMNKVAAARKAYPDIVIQVDGGINHDTAAIARAHGANSFVAGTAIFGSTDCVAAIERLRNVVSGSNLTSNIFSTDTKSKNETTCQKD